MIEKRLRKERIETKIKQIVELLDIVQENLPSEFEDFKSSRLIRDAVYKEVESVIEGVLDICNIINSDLRLGIPESEDDVLSNIKAKNILDAKSMALIEEMKKFRNVLVHKYGDIDDERAFDSIQDGLKDFEIILKAFEKLLKKY